MSAIKKQKLQKNNNTNNKNANKQKNSKAAKKFTSINER